MTTYTIPLQPGQNQTLSVLLGGQQCKISVYEKSTGTYLDLFVNDVAIATTVKCLDRTAIPIEPYKYFNGELMFIDTLGNSDPVASGFGTRYQLVWLF